MATEAAVSNSAEDVSNLPKENEEEEHIFVISTETTEDDVVITEDGAIIIEDVSATACSDDAGAAAIEVAEVVDKDTISTTTVDYSLLSKEDERLEPFLSWTTEDVAEWISKLGFPFYQNCFLCNGIDGRKLILCDAATLCKLGIKEFEHIKFIAKEVRDLLKTGEPHWYVSIADVPRNIKDLYLEQKSQTGTRADSLKLVEFERTTKETIWQPPLSNLIQSITHNGPHDNYF